MSEQHDDPLVELTLELPVSLIAQLEDLRKKFGDELLVDMVRTVTKKIEGRLALRGALINKNRK